MRSASPDFDSHQFLLELRETTAEKLLRPSGAIPEQYQEAVSVILRNADTLADKQLTFFSRHVPSLQQEIAENPDKAGIYSGSFAAIARCTAVLAIRAAKQKDTRFMGLLNSGEVQTSVLKQLARDYRRALWEVSGHDLRGISNTDLASKFVAYHDPSLINFLQERYSEVGDSYIKHAVANNPITTEESLEKATRVIDELSSDAHFEFFTHHDIKIAAFKSPKDPRAFLDTALARINGFGSDSAYEMLGPAAIKNVVMTRPINPQAFLDKAAKQFTELLADEEYARYGHALIRRAIIGYSSNPKGFLDSCRKQIDTLLTNPGYASLGESIVTHAVAYYASSPKEFLDQTLQKIKNLRENPAFAELGESYLKNAVIKNPTDPEPAIHQVIAVINELMEVPRYQSFGRAYIVQLVAHNTMDPATKVRQVLDDYDQLAADEIYASIPTYLLKRAVVNYANPREFLNSK